MNQDKQTYICELGGDTWTPSQVKLLPFERDNWYTNGEIDTRPPTSEPTLFGLEENKAKCQARWLPIKKSQIREFTINEIDNQ